MSAVTALACPAAARSPAPLPRTALVLAGSAALGAMQAGMVHALYERDIAPDLPVDTSAGALNAAFLASRCARWIPARAAASRAAVRDHRAERAAVPRTAAGREHRPPTLVATGANDEIFPEEVGRQILTDHPGVEYHALQTGHFALEDKAAEIAVLMRDFLARTVPRA
jgi:predicted acylesterase/phospholipase RssA